MIFFSQDHYSLQRCRKRVCAKIIFGNSTRPCHAAQRIYMQVAARCSVYIRPCQRLTHVSAPPYNATDDSPVRPRGRFTCPRQLATWRTTRSSVTVYNTMGDLPVRPRGRLSRPRRFTMPRPTRLLIGRIK